MIKGGAISFLVCCAMVCWGAWPTYHGGADLRGVSDAALPESPELLWRHDGGGEIYNTPVSDGERIFFSAKKGKVVALNLKGNEIWQKSFSRTNDAGAGMPVRFEAPLACAEGLVLAGSTKGVLYALDADTGETKWKYDTGGILVGSPNIIGRACSPSAPRTDGTAVPTSIVLLDQSEGSLHCLGLETGNLLWKTDGVERCDGAPGIDDGRIVFGSCMAALHVFSTEGKHLKDIEVGGDGQIAGGVALDGKLAFAGLRDGSLVCVDLEQGDIVWSSELSEEQTFSTPAVTDKLVVYSSDDGFIYAVDKDGGKPVWSFDAGGVPYSPVVAGDKVAVSADGVLFLLELSNGTKLWSKEVSDEIASPALINGMIVAGADDGTVTAFGERK